MANYKINHYVGRYSTFSFTQNLVVPLGYDERKKLIRNEYVLVTIPGRHSQVGSVEE